MWWVLGFLAVVILVAFRRGRNAVWGTMTAGLIVGAVLGFFVGWNAIWQCAISGTLLGLLFELPSHLSRRSGRKPAEWDHVD